MNRALTVAQNAILTAEHACLAIFVELQFPSGSVRFTSAGRTMKWGGVTWLGAGNLVRVEPVSESVGVQAAALAIVFSGLDPAYLTAILEDHYAGSIGRIWIATCDEQERPTDQLVGIFEGTMDEPTITWGSTLSISLTLENEFASWDRPRTRMYSDADQTHYHPGDEFCKYVAQMAGITVHWGTWRGPVAPNPLSILNRTVDRAARFFPTVKQTIIDPFRKIGDLFAGLF